MLTKMLKTLLGVRDERSFVYDIGPDAFTFYLFLRSMVEESEYREDEEWGQRIKDSPGVSAVVVHVDYPYYRDMFGQYNKGITDYVTSLKGSNWIYDYETEGNQAEVVLALSYTEPVTTMVFAVDELVEKSKRIEEQIRKAHKRDPRSVPRGYGRYKKKSSRLEKASKLVSDQKSKTDELHQKNTEKFKGRSAKKAKSNYGYTGTKHHDEQLSDIKDSNANWKATPKGMIAMYESMFEDQYGIDPPKLWTKSNSFSKKSLKLISIAKEFDWHEAMRAVAFCLDNWEEIKKHRNVQKYPTPDAIWFLRSEICMAFRAGEDPMSVLESRYENKRQKALKDGEWGDSSRYDDPDDVFIDLSDD